MTHESAIKTEASPEQRAIRYSLALERAIDGKQDEIVVLAEGCLKQAGMFGNRQSKFGKSQLNSAMTVATGTDVSYQLIKNWLRYQMSRSQQSWPEGLAKGVIIDCEGKEGVEGGLLKMADDIVKELQTEILKADLHTDEQKKLLHVRLIRLYLGFLTRCYTYVTSEQYRPEKGGH